MVGSLSERYETDRSPKGVLSGQLSQSKEAVPEWRSCDQVENGTPSTSPSYWDTDEDDDSGTKPSALYGTHTWKIEKYSQISKKELKSDAFEAGGYKWYILIYPQGCDVCNHLSLFLCVANHDKLLPGWSHFAQFTIAVVSKDTNKFKYSDTLHRFTKKEHDWGWKKFMELSGLDGFIVDDTLHIKAQVQVIRDKAYRPFRCLNYQYRRELAHIYLTNVEQICRRFFEERRGKLRKLIEDKEMWSSFSAFWLGIDQSDRRRMSREKTDVILKIIVKQFFMAKEVASTLVMDSLYSGLKALECQSKTKKSRAKPLDTEETPPPVVHVEKDMFVLADDILTLLGRAALEPLPPKDDKGSQNRAKDGSLREDISKDSAERVEKRLIELGRRTVEFFSLAHIFSTKIEVAYQEAVALKRQEELIREEEAAGQAESEQKAKRGVAEKGKKTKKKQSKHRRNSHKGKDKERDEKFVMEVQYKQEQDSLTDERTAGNFSPIPTLSMLENSDTGRDVNEISDTGEDATEILQPELEDGDASSPTNWDTDTSDLHPYAEASSCKMNGIPVQNGCEGKKSTSVMDDSSSTCSTDSVPSLEMTGPNKWSSLPGYKSRTLPMRVKNQRGKDKRHPIGSALETDNRPGGSFTDVGHLDDGSGSCKTVTPKSEAAVLSLKDHIQWLEQHLVEKEVEVVSLQRKLTIKDYVNVKELPKENVETEAFSSSRSRARNTMPHILQKEVARSTGPAKPLAVKETTSNSLQRTETIVPLRIPSPQTPTISNDAQNPTALSKSPVTLYDKPTLHQVSVMSKPLGAPLVLASRPSAPIVSVLQKTPLLTRSVSATGRLATDPTVTHSNAPQSYRNAIMGRTICSSTACFTHSSSSSSVHTSPAYSQPSPVASLPVPMPQSSSMKDKCLTRSGLTFGSVSEDVLQNPPQWLDECSRSDGSNMLSDIQKLDISSSATSRSQTGFNDETPTSTSASPKHGVLVHTLQGQSADEFPHLDIINYLLDEEHSVGKASTMFQSSNNGHHQQLNRHLTFPGNMVMSTDVGSSINCCRYDLPASYHDNGMQYVYGSSSGSFDGLKDVSPEASISYVTSEGMGGFIQNEWPVGGAHVSMLQARTPNADAYQYQLPEYSNLLCRVDGSSVFRPVNGR